VAFLQSAEGRAWGDRLEVEHGNLRRAVEWLLHTRRITPALDIASGVWRVWIKHGRLREGAQLIEQILERGDGSDDYRQALALAHLGELYRFLGEFERAREAKEAALPILRQANPVIAAATLNDLGHIAARQKRLEEAQALHEEALAIQTSVGTRGGITHATTGLAQLAITTGELVRAQALYQEILEVGRELGNVEFIFEALLGLAEVARREGDRDRSRRLYDEGLALGARMGDLSGMVDALAGMTALAVDSGQPRRAARLLGALDAMTSHSGLVPYFPDQRERSREDVRGMLADAEYAHLLAEGRAMTEEDAVAYALSR
jgi:tetratricopeptide (TPR) repeat protein